MKYVLHNYEITPIAFPVNTDVEFTIRPLAKNVAFGAEKYVINIFDMERGFHTCYENYNGRTVSAEKTSEGNLVFKASFKDEQEHTIRVVEEESGKVICDLAVYSLNEDLVERIPLRGDLHMHTTGSDGREHCYITCANYRGNGYDFMVVSDHRRYHPSLEAIEKFKEFKDTDFLIVAGEEVHMPLTQVHIVNFGGKYSVNGLLKDSAADEDFKNDTLGLAKDIDQPEPITREEYERQVREIESSLTDAPEGANTLSYATCAWVFDRIREADGLGIFAHPCWTSEGCWHIPGIDTQYMFEKHPFDAFEVLGGENYYEQNGYQTAMYYEEWKQGRVHPIVGSTDSHGSTEHNGNALICSTIVFAHSNERSELIKSIKDKYSVAVDTISPQYRLVGEFRYQKYARFLMDNWYPLHDRLCENESYWMRAYLCGTADNALDVLKEVSPQMKKMFKKYFPYANQN